LLRKICSDCREAYTPSDTILQSVGLPPGTTLHRGKGCATCKGTGFKGRTGVFELLIMNDKIKELVVNRASAEVIQKQAMADGMTLMRDDAMRKVILGLTTVEEALSVTKVD
jgi:type II secretory ATPase GspE/PulE/Tfp pilus assembly ATPase PilB-like protein